MKRFVQAAVVAVTSSTIAIAAQAETVLIANDPGPNRGVRSGAVAYLSDQIAERTGGEVRVENNWGGALFKITAALDSISAGVADMGVLVGPYAQSEMPELAIGGLTLPNAHPWVMMKALHELFTTNAAIKARLDEKNLVYVNHYGLTPNLLGCRGDGIASTGDVPGKKISHTGSSSEIFKNLGGNMVKMPVYEVYQSMDTGLIDCTVTFSYFAVATKLDELLDTITPMDYSSVTVLATLINKDTFDSLSPEHQAAILEVGAEMADYYGEKLDGADTSALEKMKSGDDPIAFKSFSEADYAAMDEAAKPITDDWLKDAAANGLDGQAMLAELIALIEKWNNVAETEGLPWTRG